MMSKYLCVLVLGLLTIGGTVLGQNEEIPVENDNQFPLDTLSNADSNGHIFEEQLMTNVVTTTQAPTTISTDSLDVALPGMLAAEYPGIPESDSTITNTSQELKKESDSELTDTLDISNASTSLKEEVVTTETFSELFTTATQSETENTTPGFLNAEETTSLVLEETSNTPQDESITTTQEMTTVTLQEEPITTPQEQKTTIVSEETTEYVPADYFSTDMEQTNESTTTSEPSTSIFTDVLKALTSSILPEEKYTTEIPVEVIDTDVSKTLTSSTLPEEKYSTDIPVEAIDTDVSKALTSSKLPEEKYSTEIPVQAIDNTEMGVSRNEEKATESPHVNAETTEQSSSDNFQRILSANVEDSGKSNIEKDTAKLQSITVENPKGELVKETTSTTQSGGVDKSITAIIVAAMVVIVAAIVIKKNWSRITKRFRSTPNRAQNEYTGVKTNGTAPEEMPLQEKNDKYPV